MMDFMILLIISIAITGVICLIAYFAHLSLPLIAFVVAVLTLIATVHSNR